MICGAKSGDNCSSVSLDPLSYPPDDLRSELFFLIIHFRKYTFITEKIVLSFLLILTHVSFSSAQPQQGIGKGRRIATICGATVGSVAFAAIVVGLLLWWRHRRNQQIFFDVNGNILFKPVLM
jgi:hypothetical protein